LNNIQMSEAQFEEQIKSCDGKIVEIDGKRYTLTLVE
jgi:hypothetical protein